MTADKSDYDSNSHFLCLWVTVWKDQASGTEECHSSRQCGRDTQSTRPEERIRSGSKLRAYPKQSLLLTGEGQLLCSMNM